MILLALIGANPNAIYPPPLSIPNLLGEYKPGDTLRLYYDTGSDITYSTFVDRVLTEGDASPNAQIPFGSVISSIASGVHAFALQGIRGAATSPISPVVIHGDTAAPSITSGATGSGAENQRILQRLVFSEVVTGVAFAGTDGALLSALNAMPAAYVDVVRADGGNLDFEAKASYAYTVTLTDRSSNASAPIACTGTVLDQDETADAASFTAVSDATPGQSYTSDEITVSGLGTGVSVPLTVASGKYRKNGGAAASSATTVVNGDKLKADGTAPAGNNESTSVSLIYGGQTVQFSISTPSTLMSFDPNAHHANISLSDAGKTATFTGASAGHSNARGLLASGYPDAFCFALTLTAVNSDTKIGLSHAGSPLTNELGYENSDFGIWCNGGYLVQSTQFGTGFGGNLTNGTVTIFVSRSRGRIWAHHTGYGWAGTGDPGTGGVDSAPGGFAVQGLGDMIPSVDLKAPGTSVGMVSPAVSRAGFTIIS